MRVALIIPLFQAAQYVDRLVASIRQQSLRPDPIILLDSSRDDATALKLQEHGLPVVQVDPASFDHGGTRNLGLRLATAAEADTIVFMTQDAVLADRHSLQVLCDVLDRSPTIGAAYGRQLPRDGAGIVERAGRAVKYPGPGDVGREERDYFFSNAFAVYRREALEGIGGFYEPALFGEDSIASYQLQENGWRVTYVPEAAAVHSHPFRPLAELRRYFDIGFATTVQPKVPQWAAAGRAGSNLRAELLWASNESGLKGVIAVAIATSVRSLGFVLGRCSPVLPIEWMARLSHAPRTYERLRRVS